MAFKLLEKCEEYFDTRDLYEVLQIERTATEKEIKKAYHKLSLLVHPDRVDENHKKIATEKFKVLSKIHSILQNEEKRRAYDSNGDVDEEADSDTSWMDYWRSIFRPISLKEIEEYEQNYLGSETEVRDVKRAYINGKGSMDHIIQSVPFSKCDHEPRYIDIVRKLVDDDEVEEYDGFFNESEKKKMRRRKKEDKEMAEFDENQDASLVEMITENANRRSNSFLEMIEKIEAEHSKKGKKKSLTSGKAPLNKRPRRQK